MPIRCPIPHCNATFKTKRGINSHVRQAHKRKIVLTTPQIDHQFGAPENSNEEYIEFGNNIAGSQNDENNQNDANIQIDDISEPFSDLGAYFPFNHQQWWLLDWMAKAQVSQTNQTRFYKDTEDHQFGFPEKGFRTYAHAEELLRGYLNPIPFDSSEFMVRGINYEMWHRDVPSVIVRLLTNPHLKNDIRYKFEPMYDEDGGRHFRSFSIIFIYFHTPSEAFLDRIYSEITNSDHFAKIEARIVALISRCSG
jgi:hypothetical protein